MPFVHVNKKFEEMTLYTKEECIGRGAGFLQRRKAAESTNYSSEPFTESVSVAKMSQALANALPVRVCVTDFKKDGSPFTNLLVMKPLFDQHGSYSHVLGLQFEASDSKYTAQTLAFIDLLARFLPDTAVA